MLHFSCECIYNMQLLLLTMDNVDNELNDVINHQFNTVASPYKIKLPVENNINK